MDDLKTILDRIRKPLSFAARDDFAHIKSLAALEPFIRTQVGELKRVSSNDVRPDELEKLFTGFDKLTPDAKKKRIIDATSLIDSLEQVIPSPSVTSASLKMPRHPPNEAPPQKTGQAGPLPAGERRKSASPSSSTGAQGETGTVLLRLDTPIQYCKGIGPKKAELLQKLGISTIEDAL